MRYLCALSAFALLSFATAALADTPPGTIMKVTPPDAKKACIAQFQMQVVRIGQLESALKLAPAQKKLFDAWRKTRLDIWRQTPCPPPPTGLDIPVPRRLENEIAALTATLDGLRREQAPTVALYDALAPEQRAIFDGPAKAPGR